ncbi:MAG TPA: T9SS type A sorting domain-containing protein, partial [Puia sp.]|nr:T9SS type A sorting domain-containing protein [Puia sp.]
KVSVGQAQQLRLELLDGAGRQVRMLLINGQRGMNTLSIQQLGGLSNGLYILRLRATDQEIQQKVIKTGR